MIHVSKVQVSMASTTTIEESYASQQEPPSAGKSHVCRQSETLEVVAVDGVVVKVGIRTVLIEETMINHNSKLTNNESFVKVDIFGNFIVRSCPFTFASS